MKTILLVLKSGPSKSGLGNVGEACTAAVHIVSASSVNGTFSCILFKLYPSVPLLGFHKFNAIFLFGVPFIRANTDFHIRKGNKLGFLTLPDSGF